MKKLPQFLALLLAIGLSGAGSAWAAGSGEGAPSAKRAAAGFYDLYFRIKAFSGVPTQKQLARFKPVLSPELFSLLAEARKAEDYYRKRTKGESPPLVEGDLFTSLFEGAGGCEVEECSTGDGSADCIVHLRYTDPADKSVTSWSDKVMLIRKQSSWLIDDVEYLGTWEFMHKGTLKTLLYDIIKESGD